MSSHWNHVYDEQPSDAVSWFEAEPTTSLELGDLLGVSREQSVIDVGAGESHYVARLLARGHHDVTVLDISPSALRALLGRLDNPLVTAVSSDVTTWEPSRTYDLWHDRAVLHFVAPERRELYAATLRRAVSARGAVIIGVFAPDGPTSCSGLPVTRYDVRDIMNLLGEEFDLVDARRTVHLTPRGAPQSFQWVAARRTKGAS